MATEATFTVATDEFPLGTIFEQVPGVTVELERIVPGNGVVIPYFWVRGVDIDDVEAAFAEHPGVKTIRLVDSVGDEYLLRAEWDSTYEGVLSTLAETEVPLISAVGTDDRWTFEIRGDRRSNVANFQQLCRDRDIPVSLTALNTLTPVETTVESSLTDPQQELLFLAYERGYFNSPRDVTMAELGEELGITQQAVASRLRRGIRQVLGRTLASLEA
ncbi:helix-turn-helix domain-containing protein [Halogeometricum limi]|uniref:Predicted DNA binding protein, contains HTH domain n=1 Tax=Halogeometricum limi TaxID=555875 RepID=A0A1I6IE51_9EURY|nr:bacterio-opsin activator domain-containing protein [Halogeometricum limi]SFR65012.1 Predicted DNA binding protein, contains HTH domain [Halogeometricum limi]